MTPLIPDLMSNYDLDQSECAKVLLLKTYICITAFQAEDVIATKTDLGEILLYRVSYIINIKEKILFIVQELPIKNFEKHVISLFVCKCKNTLNIFDSALVCYPPINIITLLDGIDMAKLKQASF